MSFVFEKPQFLEFGRWLMGREEMVTQMLRNFIDLTYWEFSPWVLGRPSFPRRIYSSGQKVFWLLTEVHVNSELESCFQGDFKWFESARQWDRLCGHKFYFSCNIDILISKILFCSHLFVFLFLLLFLIMPLVVWPINFSLCSASWLVFLSWSHKVPNNSLSYTATILSCHSPWGSIPLLFILYSEATID